MIDFDKDDVKIKRIIKVFVSSTIEIIKEDGLDAVTVREVAKISGYNPATIYNYFDNNRQLIFFASLNFMKDYFKEIENIIDRDKDPLDNYMQLWSKFCYFSYKNPKIYYSIFGENIDEDPEVLIEKYFKLYPEDFKYSPADYLPVLTDSFAENNITKPLKECVKNNCFTFKQAQKIDEVNMFFYQGMLSLLVNKRVSYSVEQATQKTVDHIQQVINNVINEEKEKLKKIEF
ncbi:MAG TPA: TetR/AcrR family transcriptional regulator [Halanaerobiales bacterium]|nr:TetR/AcrR family transcriptional regulator [Halanaerobiales bacterium]